MTNQTSVKYRGAFALALEYGFTLTGDPEILYQQLVELGWHYSVEDQVWELYDRTCQYSGAIALAFDLQLTLPRNVVENRALLYQQLDKLGYTFNGTEWVKVTR